MRVALILFACLPSLGCGGLAFDPGDGESGSGSSTTTGSEGRVMFQGGNSFGECAGACRFELTFGLDSAQLTVEDWTGAPPLQVNVGAYTPAGLALVDGVEESLVMGSLLDIYGCPDCDDGGASWASLRQADLTTTHQYEFGNPPPELAQFDTLLQDMATALRRCEASDNITPGDDCVPVDP